MDKSGGDTWITNVVAYSGSLVRTGIFIEWTDERLDHDVRNLDSNYLLPITFPSPEYTFFSTNQNIMAPWKLHPIPFGLFQVLLERSSSLRSQHPAHRH